MLELRQARDRTSEYRVQLTELGAEIDRVRQDAGFQRALDVMGRFWRYSPCNQWLIQRAQPCATRVAARSAWAELGRTVRDGAVPIQILAPSSPRGFPFIIVEVFDIAQTKGRPVPELDLVLHGRTDRVAVLERAAEKLGIRIAPLHDRRAISGCSIGGEIRIRPDLPQQERAAVIAHELAHEILHQAGPHPQRTYAAVETEAEATSYVVLRALGLPSKAPTYIAWRGGSGALIARSLRRIQRAVKRILDAAQQTSKRTTTKARGAATEVAGRDPRCEKRSDLQRSSVSVGFLAIG
jgi:hypothetical protein